MGSKILIVDDDRDAAEMLADLLGTFGYDTRVAVDGESALGIAERFRPDFALLDLELGAMSGADLAARLRQLPGLAKLCLIAVSGYAANSVRATSGNPDWAEHLIKPIDLAVLRSRLADLGARERELGEVGAAG